MQSEADITTIRKAAEGDLPAFNVLINVYKSQVYYLCLKILQVKEDAEETAQDVFVKLFRELKKFRGQSKLSTWVFRITYNECISKIRKNRKHQHHENIEDCDISYIEKSYEKIEQKEKSAILDAALNELDVDSKAVVIMYYYHDKPVGEIAEIAGMSQENVKTKLFRARKRLLYVLEKKFKLKKTEWA